MKSLTTEQTPQSDRGKWVCVVLLLVVGIAANVYFAQVAGALRAIGWIVLLGACAAIAAMTAKGKAVIAFSKDARLELRKVVWPSRQETTQTTLMVIVLVIVMSLILWGIDTFLMWAIGWMTGQRG
ncbi:MAG: secE [Gammaproteobacteria bacterium]|jgi:preprotein translocase subunit SecE|nr:secE [Gammaproteobacteria bacterium]